MMLPSHDDISMDAKIANHQPIQQNDQSDNKLSKIPNAILLQDEGISRHQQTDRYWSN